MITPICQQIKCPFLNSDPKRGYGCMRYATSRSCHLYPYLTIVTPSQEWHYLQNYYALYFAPANNAEALLPMLVQMNRTYFEEDSYYHSLLEHQVQEPELFEGGFLVKPLEEL